LEEHVNGAHGQVHDVGMALSASQGNLTDRKPNIDRSPTGPAARTRRPTASPPSAPASGAWRRSST